MKKFFLVLMLTAGCGFFSASGNELYICGDSIAADYSKRDPRPAYGWGEMLPVFCRENVAVHDLAIPGSSTKTWFDTGKWANLCAQLKAGDFVFIALCFNDTAVSNAAAFTTPEKFGENLEKMIADVRAAQATPLLVTPTVVYQPEADVNERHQNYTAAVVRTGKKTQCEVIDLNRHFRRKLAASGDAGKFFILQRSVPVPNWLDFDTVHLNRDGAALAAECIVESVREKHLSAEALFR